MGAISTLILSRGKPLWVHRCYVEECMLRYFKQRYEANLQRITCALIANVNAPLMFWGFFLFLRLVLWIQGIVFYHIQSEREKCSSWIIVF